MKMFANLRAFLYELYEDFSKHSKDIENCFYYGYLKKQKEDQASVIGESKERLAEYASRAKPNKFVLLHAAYLAFYFHKISADEYREYFKKVSYSRKKTDEMLAADIEEAADAAPYNDALEKYLLKNCVRDFFDNAGFKKLGDHAARERGGKGKPVDNSRAESKYSKRSKSLDKYTDDIAMLYRYLEYTQREVSGAALSSSEGITDKFKNECVELFDALNKDTESEVFVPLYFDRGSGAGIFIIGKEQFDESLRERITENCAVCILCFSYVSVPAEPDISDVFMDLSMNVYICKDVKAAFEEFENGVSSDKYFENYPEINKISEGCFTDPEIAERFMPRIRLLRRETAETLRGGGLRQKKIAGIIADQSAKEKRQIERLERELSDT